MNAYRKSVTSLHKYCTTRLYRALNNLRLDVGKPGGAFYVYPSFSPYAAQLNKLGVFTSADLSRWLISECGLAALPGSAFGEDDNGPVCGRFRQRMATSYLYFADEKNRYQNGYALLAACVDGQDIHLPYLEEAIAVLGAAVQKLKAVQIDDSFQSTSV